MPRDRGTPAMTRQWSFDLTQQQEQGKRGWRHCEHGEMLYGRENGVSKLTSHLLEHRALRTDSRSHPHGGLSAHVAGKPVKTGAN